MAAVNAHVDVAAVADNDADGSLATAADDDDDDDNYTQAGFDHTLAIVFYSVRAATTM